MLKQRTQNWLHNHKITAKTEQARIVTIGHALYELIKDKNGEVSLKSMQQTLSTLGVHFKESFLKLVQLSSLFTTTSLGLKIQEKL